MYDTACSALSFTLLLQVQAWDEGMMVRPMFILKQFEASLTPENTATIHLVDLIWVPDYISD